MGGAKFLDGWGRNSTWGGQVIFEGLMVGRKALFSLERVGAPNLNSRFQDFLPDFPDIPPQI